MRKKARRPNRWNSQSRPAFEINSPYRLSLLPQPRHQLDEVAGTVARIELLGEDQVPAVLDRAVGAGKRENVSPPRQHRHRPRLDGRGADRLVAQPAEQL